MTLAVKATMGTANCRRRLRRRHSMAASRPAPASDNPSAPGRRAGVPGPPARRAVGDDGDLAAQGFEHGHGYFLVDRVVLRHQDPGRQSAARAGGSGGTLAQRQWPAASTGIEHRKFGLAHRFLDVAVRAGRDRLRPALAQAAGGEHEET
ncbi:MAG: hypothetical protein U1F42_07980 [Candidatus Competibacteraceae bacterium]